MLDILSRDPLILFAYIPALVIAIAIHEFAHAWAADRLGDPTPRVQGRLTLNPLSHLDPIGTIALLLVGFGWGKPVQFDPYNLENPRRDAAIISFAGPLSNIALAVIFSLILRLMVGANIQSLAAINYILPFVYLNVVLAIFNLIPIHPLDGGKILVWLLPSDIAHNWDRILQQYGTFLLLILVLPLWGGQTIASTLIGPTIRLIVRTLLQGINLY